METDVLAPTLLPHDAAYLPDAPDGRQRFRVEIDADLLRSLDALSGSSGASVADLISAVLLILLFRRSGNDEVRLVREEGGEGPRPASLNLVEATVGRSASFEELLASVRVRGMPAAYPASGQGTLLRIDPVAPADGLADTGWQLVVDGGLRSPFPGLEACSPSAELTGDFLNSILADCIAVLRSVAATPRLRPLLPTRPCPGPAAPAQRGRPVADRGASVTAAFGEIAKRFAAKVAVEDETGARLTYSQLDGLSDRLAAGLQQRTRGAEDRVALLLERDVQLPVAMLAVLKAGLAYVPIEADTPPERIGAILDAGQVFTLIKSASVGVEPPVGPWQLLDAEEAAAGVPPDRPGFVEPALHSRSLAYVMHTSGTTGIPKGVMIEHGCITAFVAAATTLYPLSSEDRFLNFASSMFDVTTFDVFASLLNGGSLFIASQRTRLSPGRLGELMRQHRTTVYMGTPGVLEFLDPDALPDLRIMAVGGEPMAARTVNAWRQGRAFFNSYGPTETTVAVVAHRCLHDYRLTPPIGHAMPDHDAHILDERMVPVARGEIGELYIGGSGVGRGYFAMPSETAQAFVPDPFSGRAGVRLYRTGDLARQLSGGEIVFMGRRDRQVKVRGHRIELCEIEAAIRTTAGVDQAAVAVEEIGEGHRVIIAYVAPEPGTRTGDALIFERLRQLLPAYMLPNRIHIVDRIPLAQPGGKTDFGALQASVRQGTPRPAPAGPDGRSATEARLAEAIIAPILGHSDFAVDDDLIGHGIDSIQIILICARVEEEFAAAVEPHLFFDYPSIRQLGSLIDSLPRSRRR